jgi:hypothetical protein
MQFLKLQFLRNPMFKFFVCTEKYVQHKDLKYFCDVKNDQKNQTFVKMIIIIFFFAKKKI